VSRACTLRENTADGGGRRERSVKGIVREEVARAH